ncbi:hypothetical protein RND81_05G194900 [Saponaria officinalis]|uniref:Prolamin-like domain-containing protein n=1 Tax=Saponaria officinalis TaxID=3572 RepID=A0AAW1KUA4_SAPOF
MESKTTSSMNLLVTIVLLFVTSFVLARPNTVVESALAPNSPSEDYQVQKCASKIGETCGNSIFHYVFGAGKHVSKECCTILLNVGEKCHDLLTSVTIRLEHFPKQQEKEIRRKNDKAWKLCKKHGQISN